MRPWKHFDLWIVGLLVAGVFVFRHGEEALAAVGPRFSAIQNVVVAKLSALADSALTPAPAEVAVETAAPAPAGPVGTVLESSEPVVFEAISAPLAAGCHVSGHYGYAW